MASAIQEDLPVSVFYEDVTSVPPGVETNAITTDTVLTVLYFIIGILSVLGNTFVVVVIVTSASMMKSVTNTLIINQCLIDGTAGIFLILVNLIEDDGRQKSGLFDEIYCRMWLTMLPFWACMMGSSFNLMAITLERLISVWKPIWHKVSFTRRKVFALMIGCWITGPSVTLTYGNISTFIIDGQCIPYVDSSLASRATGVTMICLQYILPVFVFITGYTAIVLILRYKQKQLNQDVFSQTQRNVIKTMALVCLCFVLCWSINQGYFLSHILGHQIPFSSVFYHMSIVIVFANCCCNPFVYAFKYREFQKKVKSMFSKCKKRGQIQPHPNVSSDPT